SADGGGGAGSSGTSTSSGGAGTGAGGLPWSGVLDPARAIDWSGAGVTGGIPTRTMACATLKPGATAAQINAAIAACPEGQAVVLGAGTYSIADDGIVMKSGVTLRGAGADKTLLEFSNVNSCGGGWAAICFMGSNEWAGDNRALPGGSN